MHNFQIFPGYAFDFFFFFSPSPLILFGFLFWLVIPKSGPNLNINFGTECARGVSNFNTSEEFFQKGYFTPTEWEIRICFIKSAYKHRSSLPVKVAQEISLLVMPKSYYVQWKH